MNNIITIVTPSFNQGKFITQAIKSVLLQKGEFYVDYIIMDGGSNDDTLNIVKAFENELKKNCSITLYNGHPFYSRKDASNCQVNCSGISFRWFSEKDRGQSHAINKGLKLAIGDIFNWLNSDDYFYSYTVLNTVNAFFNSYENIDMVYGRGYCVDENENIIRDFHDNCTTLEFDSNILKRECFILQPASFARTKIVREVKGADENLYWNMDWDLWLRLSNNYRIKFIPERIANWRQHHDIKSVSNNLNMFKERFEVMKRYSSKLEYIINRFYYLSNYPGFKKYFSLQKYKRKPFKTLLYLHLIFLQLILKPFSYKKLKKPNRIAIFTPLEPLQTGIATFAQKLIAAMCKNGDFFIDIYINDGYKPKFSPSEQVRIINHKYFSMNRYYYKSILYEMGNNWDFHSYMIPYIKRHPGVVELHDVALHAIYNELLSELLYNIKNKSFIKTLKIIISYPELVYYIIQKIFKKPIQYIEKNVFRNSIIIKKATKYIIRDESNIERFNLAKRKSIEIPHGIDILPLISESEKRNIRTQFNIPCDTFVCISAGIIHQNKRIDVILASLSKIKKELHNFKYILVGKSCWHGDQIENIIKKHSVEDIVSLTGWVSNKDWFDYLSICDLGINLRSNSAGEHSGPLVRFFERGKPVIISKYDQFKVYPDEFTTKIPLDETEIDILGNAILYYYKNRESCETQGKKARQFAEKYLSLDDKISHLYMKYLL
jgi:glycosyltransferase involved in cell wall biosynthesis